MRLPKDSDPPFSDLMMEKAGKYWRELLAVGLWAIGLYTMYNAFSPSWGILDPNYSQGVYVAVTERRDADTRVNHSLQIGTTREFRTPDGQVSIPEGQLFISLQSCPVELADGRWMTTACSVRELLRSSN